MARLIYSAITSLDGYVEDETGRFDWAMPDETVHRFINGMERACGTLLYGRRLYDTMVFWETFPLTGQPDFAAEYAQIWRAADKIVFSRTLSAPRSNRTRIERSFDPEAIRRMKAAATRDISIGGAELAAAAFRAGLIDECNLFVMPVSVGGGKPALPKEDKVRLSSLGVQRFASGVVHLHYVVAGSGS